jgi:hypothetical protein
VTLLTLIYSDGNFSNILTLHDSIHSLPISQVISSQFHVYVAYYVKVCSDPAVTCADSLNIRHGGHFNNVNDLDLNISVLLFDINGNNCDYPTLFFLYKYACND